MRLFDEPPLALAPMAGYTDLAFRKLCREFGMNLSTTEMVSSKALYYGDKKSKELMRVENNKVRVSLQLFGEDPLIFEQVIDELCQEDLPFFSIDINMGCPAPKIIKDGSGAGLLNNISKAYEIVKRAVKISNIPISVKTRKGFYKGETTGLELAKACEEAGASFICIHGRTREDYYTGLADRAFIGQVADALTIPVIGNGDIQNAKDVLEYINTYHCAGVSIGRGAIGNPMIFSEIKSALNNNFIKYSDLERIKVAKRHFQYMLDIKPERRSVLEMRKHLIGYLQGLPKARTLRNEAMKLETKEEVFNWLDNLILDISRIA